MSFIVVVANDLIATIVVAAGILDDINVVVPAADLAVKNSTVLAASCACASSY